MSSSYQKNIGSNGGDAATASESNSVTSYRRSGTSLSSYGGSNVGGETDFILPSNVCKKDQLKTLPKEFLNMTKESKEADDVIDVIDSIRPLQYIDLDNNVKYTYALQPHYYSVCFILVVELLERFSFYGIYYTLTLYLTGVYDKSNNNSIDDESGGEWNAGYTSVKASSFVSLSTLVAYTTPFLGAILSDKLQIGDYHTIVLGLVFFYIPGVLLIVLTTIPYLLGDTFNDSLLLLALLVLWPLGTGIIKSIEIGRAHV